MSRAKGTRLERDVARGLVAADGQPPHIAAIASSTGRVGHLDIGADVISTRWSVECKNREDITDRLWSWLDGIRSHGTRSALVVKRNRRRPLVVLDLEDFLTLVRLESDA